MESSLQTSLKHVLEMVQRHDPAGTLAGRLLSTNRMRITYFAVRSFWIETGLRFGTTSMVPPHSSPHQHVNWWKHGIEQLYGRGETLLEGNNTNSMKNETLVDPLQHPTFKLLAALHHEHAFSKSHFDDIVQGRLLDLDVKQYPDMKALEDHAERSCGSLMQLILESDDIRQEDYPVAHQTAKLLGKAHGLTNALRTSIPIMSTTGKLIVPQDLCVKYGVRTPRYLLSALGQGDVECIQALQKVVRDISNRGLEYLQQARDLRPYIVHEADAIARGGGGGGDAPGTSKMGNIMGVFLPGLASETFLKRLEQHNYDLTNRNLRNVSVMEHARCSWRMIHGSLFQQY